MSAAEIHLRGLEYRRPEGFQLRVPSLDVEPGTAPWTKAVAMGLPSAPEPEPGGR